MFDEQDTGEICPRCDGSGEGSHDGTTCSWCKGSGVIRGEDDMPEPDDGPLDCK